MRISRWMPMALLLAGCVALVACKSVPKPPPPVKASVIASADVNPDAQNQPSPIVVRVYQLKDDAAFKEADFFALFDKEQATLGGALVSREEFELAPGDTHSFELKLSPDTRLVGVAAAYRDIRNSQWRTETGTPEAGLGEYLKKRKMTIAVNRGRVSVAPN